jgi:hypothetical protein
MGESDVERHIDVGYSVVDSDRGESAESGEWQSSKREEERRDSDQLPRRLGHCETAFGRSIGRCESTLRASSCYIILCYNNMYSDSLRSRGFVRSELITVQSAERWIQWNEGVSEITTLQILPLAPALTESTDSTVLSIDE